jgi:hypothetical protein
MVASTHPTPTSKKRSGCLIALGVVVGLLLLLALIAGLFIWRWVKSEKGQMVIGAVGDATKAARKGFNAPGTAELRAAGCQQAVVIDSADMASIVKRFIKDGGIDDAELNAQLGKLLIACDVGYGDEAPDCDELARAYLKAAGRAKRPFEIRVQGQGNKPLCVGDYNQDGKRLDDISQEESPAEESEPTQ